MLQQPKEFDFVLKLMYDFAIDMEELLSKKNIYRARLSLWENIINWLIINTNRSYVTIIYATKITIHFK